MISACGLNTQGPPSHGKPSEHSKQNRSRGPVCNFLRTENAEKGARLLAVRQTGEKAASRRKSDRNIWAKTIRRLQKT